MLQNTDVMEFYAHISQEFRYFFFLFVVFLLFCGILFFIPDQLPKSILLFILIGLYLYINVIAQRLNIDLILFGKNISDTVDHTETSFDGGDIVFMGVLVNYLTRFMTVVLCVDVIIIVYDSLK